MGLGRYLFGLGCLALSVGAQASSFEDWLVLQKSRSENKMFENIGPKGATRGAVVASPSRQNPNYFFHWVRDASLVMGEVVSKYEDVAPALCKNAFGQLVWDFVDFSAQNQNTSNPSGDVGEPKFMADGTPFLEPWGRPQNDGPALRAITLIRWANQLINEGHRDWVHEKLYRAELPTQSVIKIDLEFVANHWSKPSYDIWEEVSGKHFYTRMVQRRALVEGAALARRLHDEEAAKHYDRARKDLEIEINYHHDYGREIILTTIDRNAGIDYKHTNLDTATILGVLHGETQDGFFALSSDVVLNTALELEKSFRKLYPINDGAQGAVAMGRYPEDTYDGYHTSGLGNPWFITTHAMAEYYYRLRAELNEKGKIHITPVNRIFYQSLADRVLSNTVEIHRNDSAFARILKGLFEKGDEYLERSRYHSPQDGSLAEQINRVHGFNQGARDLTWSYSSFLTALRARR